MAYGIWHMKKIPCLLALALFIPSLQACRKETAKSDSGAGAAAQGQTSPGGDSQQANETVVPAPGEFKEVLVGTIDDKHAVRMELERKDADLTGSYFYERAGAFNSAIRTLELKGRIDGDGMSVWPKRLMRGAVRRRPASSKANSMV